MSKAIEVSSLVKQFGDYTALKGISFSVPEHSVVGFLGPNGAGKTTTLRILAGLSEATSGTVSFFGQRTHFGMQNGAADIGYLPEQPAIYPWMTALEYLRFIGGLGNTRVSGLAARIQQVLKTVGLFEAKKRRVAGYSNGMRQRLGIAQAILTNPRVLIFDEPVSALDPLGRREILQLMQQLKDEHTILFSSHILSDVERLCKEVIVINKGAIITQSTVVKLKQEFAKPQVRIQFGKMPTNSEIEALRKLPGVRMITKETDTIELTVEPTCAENNDLLMAISNLNTPIVSYGFEQPELEDIFVNLVTQNNE